MQIIHNQDIFTAPDSKSNTNVICVTTNGMIKKDGTAVMGAGIAKIVNERFHVAGKLADHLRHHGNIVCDLGEYTYEHSKFHLVSFPTKHHWRYPSNPRLIELSAKQLVALADEKQYERIFLTPPGCGCGGLDWENDVRPILEPIFDDRFIIVFR